MKKAISADFIETGRLKMHVLSSGNDAATETVLFIHGNASSSVFWKGLMRALPPQYRAFAPDLRGYGDTEDALIDATHGMMDFVDDLQSLTNTLKINRYHVVGHSMGGSVIWSLLAAEGEKIASITLVNPGSPYGFGGTKDEYGTPCNPDFAGSGGGIVNPQFAEFIRTKYKGSEDPVASPRVVMNNFYWKPPFKPDNEEELLDSLLSERVGAQRYPGDFVPSAHYPFAAPGVWGPANALSPKYVGESVKNFVESAHKPPILWVRGSDDQIVSDQSLFCMGTLGKLGFIPNYPSEAVYPPQPMVGQTRYVLQQYAEKGGTFQEIVMPETGHTPFVEKQALFLTEFLAFLEGK
jgi:pimeloyl-ACP methyl ester carboxylesterase